MNDLMKSYGYTELAYPTIPGGWMFCMKCGKPMQWADIPRDAFDPRTGAPMRVWVYRCSANPSHDSIESGRLLTDALFR